MRSTAALSLLVGLLGLALPASHLAAQAAPQHDARSDRIQGLTRADLARIEPYLTYGPVALVEFADTDADQLPAINVASLVEAPAADVAALVSRPDGYSRFMRTLDEVKVISRRGTAQVYDWHWSMGLFELSGRNSMQTYPTSARRPDAGYRFTVDSQSGDFGAGRMVMRVLPRGPKRSLLIASVRLDLRRSNYIARQISRAARSVNRTANMSLAYAMVLSFRAEAQRRAGTRSADVSWPLHHKPPVDRNAILPLLVRGDLVLLDMREEHLEQLAVFGLVHSERSVVHAIMLDANALGSALVPGSAATVVGRKGLETTFDWDIDLPLVGVSGRMTLRDSDPVVAVRAVDGALEGGRWSFETQGLSKDATMVASWASFDLRNSTWLVRKIISADPYLGHGMSAASEVMLMRALRSRARKVREGELKLTPAPPPPQQPPGPQTAQR